MKEKPGTGKTNIKSCASFRSGEDWKSALMTLPDSNFFELLRSVFGNIKTPFNKQSLMEDLNNLLSRDEIRKVITAYISRQDHKLIAAIALLGEAGCGSVAPGILESFFAGEFSYAELHAMIINLEERLIIYRFKNEGLMCLALNPVLEEVLNPFIEDTRPILPRLIKPGEMIHHSGFAMNDPRYMAALFSFFMGEEELFKTEEGAGIRKKVIGDWKKIFPRLDLNLVIRTLLQLGLFKSENCRLAPCSEKIAEFSALSSLERQEYWAAGMYLCLDSPSGQEEASEHFTGASKIRLRGIASFINRFRTSIEPECSYPETTLRRLEMLMEKNDERCIVKGGSGKAWGYTLFDSPVRLKFEPLLNVMESAGLLEKEKTHWKVPVTPSGAEDQSGKAKPVLVMDSAYSVILYPEISFTDALALGTFCSVKENDRTVSEHAPEPKAGRSFRSTVCFELTRESAVRGFNQGIKAAGMYELLDRLSDGRLDANLKWTLKEWESRYEGVALHQGILLRLAEDRLYLAEAEPVASLIQQTFAPGLYLLSSEEKPEAVKALKKAGVDIIAQPSVPTVHRQRLSASSGETGRRFSHGLSHGFSRDSFPRLDASGGELRHTLASSGSAASTGKTGEADFYLDNFRSILESMKLGKLEKEELSARIERRLVLSEAQLEAASLRYEKTEARLLDYRGKVSIAKHAIDSGSLVEVTWTDSGGKTRQFTGIAQALEKKEGDSILILRETENSSKTISLPLGKISLLRRIKQSIFGG